MSTEFIVGQEWSGTHGTLQLIEQRPGDMWLVSDPVYQEEIVLASRTLSAWISQSGAVGRLENFKQHWEKVKNKNNY
jgi:hypothetical protein